jgi:hypothetical protein
MIHRRVAENEACDSLSPSLFPSSRSRPRRGCGDGDELFEQPSFPSRTGGFFEHEDRSSASTVSLDHRCSFRRWKATASETRRRSSIFFEAQRPRRSSRLGRGRLLDHSPLLMPTRICVNSVLCGLQDAIEAIEFSKDSLFTFSRGPSFATRQIVELKSRSLARNEILDLWRRRRLSISGDGEGSRSLAVPSSSSMVLVVEDCRRRSASTDPKPPQRNERS